MYAFTPSGVCSRQIRFSVTDGKLHNLVFEGGCPGSLRAITLLLEGQDIATVITTLQGVTCGNKPTSCPDQLARALADVAEGNDDRLRRGTGLGGVMRALNPFS